MKIRCVLLVPFPVFGCFKRAAYSIVRVTHILLLTGVFQGHDCRSNGSILGARGTFKLFLKKIFDVVIRSNMAAIFFLHDLGASVVEVKKWVSYTDILSYE